MTGEAVRRSIIAPRPLLSLYRVDAFLIYIHGCEHDVSVDTTIHITISFHLGMHELRVNNVKYDSRIH